jgi:hypothetical protein
MRHHHEIHQRDDGMFDVIAGDTTAGRFETMSFAVALAEGRKPEPKPAAKFRWFKILREVLDASA